MALVKRSICTECKKTFFWKIDRPSDGYWDRWRSDDGDTLSAWFLTNNLCWEHAFTKMPERFRKIIKTVEYTESEPIQKASA